MGRGYCLRPDALIREACHAQPLRVPGVVLTDRGAGRPLWREPNRPRALDLLAVGQNSLDRICVVAAAPAMGSKHAVEEMLELPGGQVATAALACARLGLRTAYAGAVGADHHGVTVLAPLREAGVDVSAVRRVPGARTQMAVIHVDSHGGERTV